MKNITLSFLLLILFVSCKATLFNLALEKTGVYDDSISLSKMSNDEREIIFFPIHHIGTELFYVDVKNKVDSLENIGYYFYLEKVGADKKRDTILRKFKKINGLAFNQNGYTDNIDSLFKSKFKAKKDITNQPTYKKLGVDSISSKVVDVTIGNIITYYENKYHKILLEPCDFETTLFEESTCEDKKMNKEIRQDVIVNYRNQVVIKEIISDPKKKIAIIYGKDHYEGIKEGLIKEGYTEN